MDLRAENDLFCVDFDTVWVGLFSQKIHAKTSLYRIGKINEDFIIDKFKTKDKQRGGHNKEKIMMTEYMHKAFVAACLNTVRSAKIDREDIAGIKILRHNPPIEQDTIGFLFTLLKDYKPSREFFCVKYRIDLYFKKQKLAIECDEYGHQNRDPKNEAERQTFLSEKLDCKFIRFNPHASDFVFADVSYKILEYLNSKSL